MLDRPAAHPRAAGRSLGRRTPSNPIGGFNRRFRRV